MINNIYDAIVIGGGPAGISASCYASRYGLKTLLITNNIGGQVKYTHKIFSNPSAGHGIKSKELIKRYEESLNKESVAIILEEVVGIEKEGNIFSVETISDKYFSRTVIIATGRRPKKIDIPFDDSVKNKGVCYFTDYPYQELKGEKNVLLIGGGYCGLDTAGCIKDFVDKVIIIEKSDKLGGNLKRQKEIESQKNIEIKKETFLQKVYESKNGLHAILNNQGNLEEIIIDKIFVAIGTTPNSEFLKNIKKNNNSEIIISLSKNNEKMYMTSLKGVFACGDCNDMPAKGFEPLSIGEGIQCAKVVANYLNNEFYTF